MSLDFRGILDFKKIQNYIFFLSDLHSEYCFKLFRGTEWDFWFSSPLCKLIPGLSIYQQRQEIREVSLTKSHL